MDYKEKYNTALERARKMHHETEFDYEKGMMEEIFPELKEPNDERIRKALIEYFGEQCDMSDWNGVYGYQVLAWLEKQGHMLSPDKVVEWLECKAFQGWAEEINIKQIVDKFKKDFGL